MFNSLRISLAAIALIVALFIVHKWLPAGRRRFVTILPGIAMTLVAWLIAGELSAIIFRTSPTPMSATTRASRRR